MLLCPGEELAELLVSGHWPSCWPALSPPLVGEDTGSYNLLLSGEEMAELLVSGQLAFMLARSVPSSTISLQAALDILTAAFRQDATPLTSPPPSHHSLKLNLDNGICAKCIDVWEMSQQIVPHL
jgi:hypothetical protein